MVDFVRRKLLEATSLMVGSSVLGSSALAQTGKRTVTIWSHFAGSNFDIFNRFTEEFQKTAPDIDIKASSYGAAEILPKYLAAVAAGAPPDIFHAPGYVPPELALNKVIIPLDNLVKLDPTTLKNFDETTIFDGKRYGIPVNGGLGAMCYNVEMMEKAGVDPKKPPDTWDELIAAAIKMTNPAENRWGLMLGNQPGFLTAESYYSFLISAGGDLLSPDGKASAFHSAAGLDALTFYADAVNKHKISPKKLYTDVQAWSEWPTRKVGSVLLYPVWMSAILSSKVPSITAPPPIRVKRGAHWAGNYWTISTLSKNQEAAAKFCQWWVQPGISGRWAGESGGIPNSQKAIESPEFKMFQSKNPLSQAFIDTIPFARPFPGVIGVSAVIQIVSEMVQAVVLGGDAPKDALAKAATRADQALTRAQKR